MMDFLALFIGVLLISTVFLLVFTGFTFLGLWPWVGFIITGLMVSVALQMAATKK